jgi:hypothetical protein
VKIRYDSKNHYLGSFDTKQEAALAYDRAARQCGEDKLLNYEQPKPRPPSGFYGVSECKWEAVVSVYPLRRQAALPRLLRH